MILDQCAQLSPHNSAFYLNQAVLYQKLGQIEKTKKLLSTVRNEANNDPDSLAKAGKIYDEIGDRVVAHMVIERALSIAPQNRLAISSMADLKNELAHNKESE